MSKIEWTDRVWNPITGCSKISQGCKNCYAEKMHKRLAAMGQKKYQHPFTTVKIWEEELSKPLSWKKPCKIFVNSMSDLFHESVSFEFIENVFLIINRCPQHQFQILTKRPVRMIEFIKYYSNKAGKDFPNYPLPIYNTWFGISVENEATANERIPFLFQMPTSFKTFISFEPLLSKIDLEYLDCFKDGDGFPSLQRAKRLLSKHLHWAIIGGESGKDARPMHPYWALNLATKLNDFFDIPVFFKQWGEFKPGRIFKSFESWREHGHMLQLDNYKLGKDCCIDMKGDLIQCGKDFKTAKYPVISMIKVGKHKSGNNILVTGNNTFKKFPKEMEAQND